MHVCVCLCVYMCVGMCVYMYVSMFGSVCMCVSNRYCLHCCTRQGRVIHDPC